MQSAVVRRDALRSIRGRWVLRSSGGGAAANGADMFTRTRLICAGLLAAATKAALVGAPAMVQAGITFNLLD
jgi:hypothetical protein